MSQKLHQVEPTHTPRYVQPPKHVAGTGENFPHSITIDYKDANFLLRWIERFRRLFFKDYAIKRTRKSDLKTEWLCDDFAAFSYNTWSEDWKLRKQLRYHNAIELKSNLELWMQGYKIQIEKVID